VSPPAPSDAATGGEAPPPPPPPALLLRVRRKRSGGGGGGIARAPLEAAASEDAVAGLLGKRVTLTAGGGGSTTNPLARGSGRTLVMQVEGEAPALQRSAGSLADQEALRAAVAAQDRATFASLAIKRPGGGSARKAARPDAGAAGAGRDAGGALPDGWVEAFSKSKQLPYWRNESTGATTWTKPEQSQQAAVSDGAAAAEAELPAGWTEAWSKSKDRPYWRNDSSGETTWTRPL
jgi:hypothetical protein